MIFNFFISDSQRSLDRGMFRITIFDTISQYNNGYETNGQIAHAIILVFAL